MVKICTKCNEEKEVSEFYGRNKDCRKCRNAYLRSYNDSPEKREKNRQKDRAYRALNKEKISAKQNEYRTLNKDELSYKRSLKRQENLESTRAKEREYHAKNKDYFNEKARENRFKKEPGRNQPLNSS